MSLTDFVDWIASAGLALRAFTFLAICIHMFLWERRENMLWREHWQAWRELRRRYNL